MPQRTFLFLSVALIAIAAALILNLFSVFWPQEYESFISKKDVSGVAVSHKQKLYTLSFTQQNELLSMLNHSIRIKVDARGKESNVDVDKIVIYRFNAPPVEIRPIAFIDHNLLYSAPDWDKNFFLKEVSHGQLEKLIRETYDP